MEKVMLNMGFEPGIDELAIRRFKLTTIRSNSNQALTNAILSKSFVHQLCEALQKPLESVVSKRKVNKNVGFTKQDNY